MAQNSQPLMFSGRRIATIAPTVPHTMPNASDAPRNPHDVGTGVSRVANRINSAAPAMLIVTSHDATAARRRARAVSTRG